MASRRPAGGGGCCRDLQQQAAAQSAAAREWRISVFGLRGSRQGGMNLPAVEGRTREQVKRSDTCAAKATMSLRDFFIRTVLMQDFNTRQDYLMDVHIKGNSGFSLRIQEVLCITCRLSQYQAHDAMVLLTLSSSQPLSILPTHSAHQRSNSCLPVNQFLPFSRIWCSCSLFESL